MKFSLFWIVITQRLLICVLINSPTSLPFSPSPPPSLRGDLASPGSALNSHHLERYGGVVKLVHDLDANAIKKESWVQEWRELR